MKPVVPVSVVIPACNGESYLGDALTSIRDQTVAPTEIVVVDDCSSDGTVDLVDRFAKTHPDTGVNLIRRTANSGSPAKPMNEGILASRSEFICILDQDDVWLPTKIEWQHRVLSRMPDVAFVFSLFGMMGRRRRTQWLRWLWLRRLTPSMSREGDVYKCSGETAFDLLVRLENYTAGFPGFMFRRSDWVMRQGFDESLSIAMDYDFLCWLCERGSVAFVPETHFLRREHGNNLTWREAPRLIDVIRVLTRYIDHEELQRRSDYRRALASKIVRLAQFFAYCGCAPQSEQMLRKHFELRNMKSNTFLRLLRRIQIRFVKPISRFIGLLNLRGVTPEEADECSETVASLLMDHGQQSAESRLLQGRPHPRSAIAGHTPTSERDEQHHSREIAHPA